MSLANLVQDVLEDLASNQENPPPISPAKMAEHHWPEREHRSVELTNPPKEGHRVELGE